MPPPWTPLVFIALVASGWSVVLYVRARMAWPDAPRPLRRIDLVTGTINIAALAFAALYAATP